MTDSASSSPATVAIVCPACSKRLRLKLVDGAAERLRVRCPSCAHAFVVRRRVAEGADWTRAGATVSEGTGATLEGSLEGSGAGRSGSSQEVDSQAVFSRSLGEAAERISLGEERAFAIGELVAGRWRVIRYIARGGMGEVYEAEDTALKEIVALKTVLPQIVTNDRAIERFMREVSVARQVTHRNVCRIHDLGTHRSEGRLAARYASGEVPFVTMEMLRGESLAARLARRRFDPDEALLVLRQMASALDAAHAAGIVHRDFKSGNVMLEPAADGVRAVVTDFGLARGIQPDARFGATVTMADGLLGSPAYMAPEQVDGRIPGPRADVYAFATVAYEMVTGSLPFEAENPLAAAVKRLTENPIRPRAVRPDLSEVWEKTLLRGLDRSPDARYPTAGQLVEALEGRAEAPPPTREEREAAARRPTPRRLLLAVVAGLLLAIALIVNFAVWQQRREAAAGVGVLGMTVPTSARASIAVLGLDDLSGQQDLAWLGPALTEMLGSELAEGGQLRVVPGEAVARFRRDTAIGANRTLAGETLGAVRVGLGADYVVVGSYAAIGSGGERQVRLDVKLQDTLAEGRTISANRTGLEAELFQLVGQVGAELRSSLGVESASKSTPERTDLDAERLYAEGLERLNALDAAGARDPLVRVAELLPRDPRPHAALARTWLALGYGGRAATEAALAEELGDDLPEAERVANSLLLREARGDLEGAVRLAEDRWRAAPDDVEAGLTLSRLLAEVGRGPEALQVIEVLRRLPTASSADPRLALAEATQVAATGNFAGQLAAARSAREGAAAQGLTSLEARAWLIEAGALRALGDLAGARAAVATARERFGTAKDGPGLIAALSMSGTVAFDSGDLLEASRIFREAAANARDLGDRGTEVAIRNNLAVVARQLGQLDEAEREYEALLAAAEEIGARRPVVQALTNRAAVRVQRGDVTGARTLVLAARPLAEELGDRALEASVRSSLAVVERRLAELGAARTDEESALALRRELGQRPLMASSLVNLGLIAWQEGRLAQATEALDEALSLARETEAKRYEAAALDALGRVAITRGDAVRARELHEEALALRRESSDPPGILESRSAIAMIDLAQNQREDAEIALREVLTAVRGLGSPDAIAESEASLALVLLGQRRVAEARELVDAAQVRARSSQQPLVRHAVEVAAARVAAGQGRDADARRGLEAAAAAAASKGLVVARLEAEIALGQLLAEAGEGAALLARAREEASALGLGSLVGAAP